MIRDLLGDRATDRLLDEIGPVLTTMKRLGWNEVKPWGEFFATFKPPQLNGKHLEQRVTTNFLYYRTNYLHICLVILALRVISAPMIVLSAFAIFGVWTYLLTIYDRPLVVGDIIFDNVGKQWLCVGFSFLILLMTGTIERLLWTIFYCSILCGGHMVFRPRNVSSKANRMYEEAKISGYGGFFNSDVYEAKVYDSKVEDVEVPPESYEADGKYGDVNIRRRNHAANSMAGSGKYSD